MGYWLFATASLRCAVHQDQKVGLALGVLLLGVVAAFFFRNESHATRAVPALRHAAALQREIADKRWTPYFPDQRLAADVEPEDPFGDASLSERPLPAGPQNSDRGAIEFDPRPAPIASQTAIIASRRLTENADENALPQPAPDPIRYAPSKGAEAVAEVDLEPADAGDFTPTAARTAREHEVQRGETLSSIADNYLGSPARYRQIYEANRDRLSSPDDLQIGLRLRIPDPASKSTDIPRTEVAAVPLSDQQTADDKSGNFPIESGLKAVPRIGVVPEKPDLKFTPHRGRQR
jgi:hypothetical protein